MDKKQFIKPTINETNVLFEDLLNQDFSKYDSKQIWNYINSKFPTELFIMHNFVIKNTPLYRFRDEKTIKTYEDINLKTTFYYPPESVDLTEKTRCANEKERVLYLSYDEYTTVFETRCKIGDIGYLTEWYVDLPNDTNIKEHTFFYSEKCLNNKDSYAGDYCKIICNQIDIIDEVCENEEEKNNLIYFLQKFQDLFRIQSNNKEEEQRNYRITAAISSNIFNSIGIPIISYPSISTNQESINFAFRQDVSDKYIKLKNIKKIKINSINDTNMKCDLLSSGICNDNNLIIWD